MSNYVQCLSFIQEERAQNLLVTLKRTISLSARDESWCANEVKRKEEEEMMIKENSFEAFSIKRNREIWQYSIGKVNRGCLVFCSCHFLLF